MIWDFLQGEQSCFLFRATLSPLLPLILRCYRKMTRILMNHLVTGQNWKPCVILIQCVLLNSLHREGATYEDCKEVVNWCSGIGKMASSVSQGILRQIPAVEEVTLEHCKKKQIVKHHSQEMALQRQVFVDFFCKPERLRNQEELQWTAWKRFLAFEKKKAMPWQWNHAHSLKSEIGAIKDEESARRGIKNDVSRDHVLCFMLHEIMCKFRIIFDQNLFIDQLFSF